MDTKAFYDMTYGIFVLSARTADGKLTGCTVNTVFQTTSTPPVIAVSVNHQNYTNAVIQDTGVFTVTILNQEAPMDLIGGFGFRSGRDCDKFDGVPHALTEQGLPYITEHACAYLECKVVDRVELSTHTLFLAEVTDCVRLGGGKVPPMTYAYYHSVKNGTVPKTAPHYVEEEKPMADKTVWVCPMCGFEYDSEEVPFEELPDDWKCPLCKLPKGKFVKKP